MNAENSEELGWTEHLRFINQKIELICITHSRFHFSPKPLIKKVKINEQNVVKRLFLSCKTGFKLF